MTSVFLRLFVDVSPDSDLDSVCVCVCAANGGMHSYIVSCKGAKGREIKRENAKQIIIAMDQ